jgi:DNA polymerase-3 subunit gamma/tau
MSYQVLARRWRPKAFSDVVGQDHVTRTIKNALKQGRLAHAFLFTGPRGCGKTSTARILARAVNCPNIDLQGDPEPCNECETCRALFEDRELDVIEMDAASYRGIEDVRRINDTCRLAPVAGRRKVYIIDEVHMFTREAFNALLKTLEEPPAHVIFILATTDVHKVPATILSRVQRFDFRPVQPSDVAPHLAKICAAEGWAAEPEALWLIARRGDGSLRDAEGLLDQVVSFSGNQVSLAATRDVLGLLPGELLAQATKLVNDKSIGAVPAYLEQLALRGTDYTEYLKGLQAYWMDLVFLKEGLPVPSRSEEEIAQMRAASAELGVDDMFRLIRLAETLEDGLKWSTAPRVRFEISFLRWVTMDRMVAIRDMLTHLDRLAPVAPATSGISEPAPAGPAAASIRPSAPAGQAVAPATQAAAPVPPRTPSAPAVAPAAPSEPAAAAVTPKPAGGATTLEQLQEVWPNILRALRNRNGMAAVMAEKGWLLESLAGVKLTVSCKSPDKFQYEQMNLNIPHLAAAIADVCGVTLTVIAAPQRTAPAPEPAPREAAADPAPSPTPLPGNDLFNSLVVRFGGVEVDPNKTREPK